MKFRLSPFFAALSALAFLGAGFWLLERSEYKRFDQETRADVLNELNTIGAKLEGGLNSQLFLARGLVAQISTNPNITKEQLDSQIKVMFAHQRGIRNITLTKGTVITYQYPPKFEHKTAIGIDLAWIPEQRQSIDQAINTRKSMVLGPINLIQGGVGFVNRSPIFITPKNAHPESGSFWGFINFVIEQNILFQEAGLYDSSEQMQYALRGKNGSGSLGEVFLGDASIFQKNPVLVKVKLPNGYWQLAGIPKRGWPSISPITIWLRIGGSLLALLTGILVFNWRSEPLKLEAIVQKTTKKLLESELQYRELVENANSIIIKLDAVGKVNFFNEFAQNFFGYTQEEIVGKSAIGRIISTTDNDRYDWEIMARDILQNSQLYMSNEKQNIRRSGELVWVYWRNKALVDDQGKLAGILCVGNDISDRKQAEFALQKANEDLEIRVEERTADLKQALEKLQTEITEREATEEELRQSEAREREKSQQLERTLTQLQSTQAQLIQTEKMSSLGQLVAGIAHEINNPVNFIHGNINYVDDYVQNLLEILQLYQQEYPQPTGEIPALIEAIELDFLTEDLAKILSSMKLGTQRIRSIVLSLRNFSRLDEYEMKPVDIHEGIESTLLILHNRFKRKNNFPDIRLVKQFGDLPLVECYAGQLNQVFMNVITNGIDAIEQKFQPLSLEEIKVNPGQIMIATKVKDHTLVIIEISDNGSGMSAAVKSQIFNPFFTTKEVGKGTGLGMSISYQIVVEQHQGKFDCISEIDQGTTFMIQIPIKS
jgi:two-component system NtrC family sensor kinase